MSKEDYSDIIIIVLVIFMVLGFVMIMMYVTGYNFVKQDLLDYMCFNITGNENVHAKVQIITKNLNCIYNQTTNELEPEPRIKITNTK